MELKKLLMSCGKDDACGQPGSPKIEGVGKKGVAGQQQVRAQKLLLQHPPSLVPGLCCHVVWQ